jgi:hypothetical protein
VVLLSQIKTAHGSPRNASQSKTSLNQKGTVHMRSHIRFGLILATAAASLMSSTAFAQTPSPSAGSPAPAVIATTTTVTNWMTQEGAGQWRGSKLIGLNVFNDANEKVGDISELILDRSGKLDAVVIGAGGFLGLGQHDVAVPYGQITWSYQPVASSRSGTPTVTTGAAGSTTQRSEGPRSYPDHAVLNMTKDQLKAAPEFKYSR